MWSVNFSRDGAKHYNKLKRSGQKKPSIVDVIDALVLDLKAHGPILFEWPNYGKIQDDNYHHCHLKKGRPTYVACWRVINEQFKEIEVFYVGTHESTPY